MSDQLEAWLESDADHTLGGLVDVFDEKSFALLFILLLGVAALPLPTGGATHVFEVIALLVAGQLVIGRDEIWIPARWKGVRLDGEKRAKLTSGLLRVIRFLERFSHPRGRFLFDRRPTNVVFGLLVIGFTLGALLAVPFSGLDTLPAMGVVLLSIGVLLEDVRIAILGIVVGAAGIVLEITVGKALADWISGLF